MGFLTNVLGYKQTYVNRRNGKEWERQGNNHDELFGYDTTRIPDRVGGRDYERRKRNVYSGK